MCTVFVCGCNQESGGSVAANATKSSGSILKGSNANDHVGDFLVASKLSDNRLVAAYGNEKGSLDIAVEKTKGSRDFTIYSIKPGKNRVGLYNALTIVDDRIHLLTYDQTQHQLWSMHGDANGFSAPVLVDDGDGGKRNVGMWTTLTSDSHGNLHAVYYDATLKKPWYAYLAKDSQTWKKMLVQAVDSQSSLAKTMDVGQHNSLVMSAQDMPVFATYRAGDNLGDGDAYLYVAQAAGDQLEWRLIPLETQDDVGNWLRLKRLGDNQYAACHYNASKGNLHYTTIDLDKMQRTVQVVDKLGNVGFDCDFAIDAQGKAHLAYLSATGFDLKEAVQTAHGFEVSTIDSAGIVGFFPAIQFVDNDNPTILYHLSYLNQDTAQKVMIYPPATN